MAKICICHKERRQLVSTLTCIFASGVTGVQEPLRILSWKLFAKKLPLKREELRRFSLKNSKNGAKKKLSFRTKNSLPRSQRDTETGSFFSCGFSTGAASQWLLKTPQEEKCGRETSDCLSKTSLLQIDRDKI